MQSPLIILEDGHKRGRDPREMTGEVRIRRMKEMAAGGKTFQDIATEFGISRERVRQLGKLYGFASIGIPACSKCGRDKTLIGRVRPIFRCAACAAEIRKDIAAKLVASLIAAGLPSGMSKTEFNQRYNLRHPEKRRAHKAVERALASGLLSRLVCQVCSDAETQAHHEDYSRPLEVTWLCSLHHHNRHSQLRRQCAAVAESTS